MDDAAKAYDACVSHGGIDRLKPTTTRERDGGTAEGGAGGKEQTVRRRRKNQIEREGVWYK